MYSLGAIPSPKDPRDYRLTYVAAVHDDHPHDYRLTPLSAVRDQGSSSMCVAFAIATMKRYQERREGRFDDYSPAYIYANRGAGDWQGEGMVAREALERLRDAGVCRQTMFPGVGSYASVRDRITAEMHTDAAPQRVQTYIQVTTPAEVQTAVIDLQSPVLVIVPVFAGWYRYRSGLLPTGDTVEGYHAMLIVGWRPDAWLVQNSWGTGWGEGGYGWLPTDYPITEMWAVTDRIATPPARRVQLAIGSRVGLIDGELTMIDVPPIIVEGRTLVPLRFIGEAFGATVGWDAETKTVTIVQTR